MQVVSSSLSESALGTESAGHTSINETTHRITYFSIQDYLRVGNYDAFWPPKAGYEVLHLGTFLLFRLLLAFCVFEGFER